MSMSFFGLLLSLCALSAFGADGDACELENAALRCRVNGASFQIEDKRTGRTWSPSPDTFRGEVLGTCRDVDDAVHVSLVHTNDNRRFGASISVAKDLPEVVVEVTGDGELNSPLNYPAAFSTQKGDRLIVPLNEGVGYPADEEDQIPARLQAYSGHGICMAFFGVQDDATGAGWMAIIETPDDASLVARRDGATNLWTIGPSWESSRKTFGYARRIRYIFFDKGGYVAMCKRYREHARKIGRFKTFDEKAKSRPSVDRLLGAVNVWCWEWDVVGVVKELKSAGIDRILWSNGGNADQVKALAEMPDVLVGCYDVYQDVYHPEQIKKLGMKSGVNSEAWPDDVVWSGPTSNDWSKAWGVKAKDGTWTYCARMCDRVSPAYARRKIAADLKTKPYNSRFVDCAMAGRWCECWNPRHPMTRTDSRKARVELLGVVGDEFGLVVGSETGHDAGVPVCDYFEGMMSLVPYRVPDSGRKLGQIWTNAPPRVAKYQTGEAYRLPLWELVYHECVCAHWYWGDYNNKLPELWAKRDLFNMLYGTMGMFVINKKKWDADKERFLRSYRLTSPIARATGYSEMTSHRILTPDRKVQESRFADGTVVIVNFGDRPHAFPDGRELEGGGFLVETGRR